MSLWKSSTSVTRGPSTASTSRATWSARGRTISSTSPGTPVKADVTSVQDGRPGQGGCRESERRWSSVFVPRLNKSGEMKITGRRPGSIGPTTLAPAQLAFGNRDGRRDAESPGHPVLLPGLVRRRPSGPDRLRPSLARARRGTASAGSRGTPLSRRPSAPPSGPSFRRSAAVPSPSALTW